MTTSALKLFAIMLIPIIYACSAARADTVAGNIILPAALMENMKDLVTKTTWFYEPAINVSVDAEALRFVKPLPK